MKATMKRVLPSNFETKMTFCLALPRTRIELTLKQALQVSTQDGIVASGSSSSSESTS